MIRHFLAPLGFILIILSVVFAGWHFMLTANPDGSDVDTSPETLYEVIQIGGCEYVYLSRRPWGAEMAIAHKGNCTNSLHRAE